MKITLYSKYDIGDSVQYGHWANDTGTIVDVTWSPLQGFKYRVKFGHGHTDWYEEDLLRPPVE